jgi:uncharacterized membrane protein
MAERSSVEVGFTAEDRKILYQVEVRMQRLEGDVKDVRVEVRDGLGRIAKLEADRVVRKDIEDLLQVIEEKSEENTNLLKQTSQFEVRIGELERARPELETVKKMVWIGIGGLAVLEFALGFLFKK